MYNEMLVQEHGMVFHGMDIEGDNHAIMLGQEQRKVPHRRHHQSACASRPSSMALTDEADKAHAEQIRFI